MKRAVLSANTCWYLFNFRANTVRALQSDGFEVHVVAPHDKYSDDLIKLGCLFHHVSIDRGGANPFRDLCSLIGFLSIYRRIRPDVVLNFTPKNNIYSTIAAKFFSVKVINNIAGLGVVFVRKGILSMLVKVLYKVSQRFADHVFFQNTSDRDFLLKNYSVLDGHYSLIPGSGVDLSRFSVSPSLNEGSVKFLLVSRMLYEKGITYYYEAGKILKERHGDKVCFSMVGFIDEKNPSGLSAAQIAEWAESGVLSYLGVSDTIEDLVAAADCIVLPSFYREGVPKSLLEAAAMAKPIITTDNIGCIDTVIDGVSGFICKMRSVASLVEAMDKMIVLSHDDRIRMGMSGRAHVEANFDENIVISAYLNKIHEVCI